MFNLANPVSFSFILITIGLILVGVAVGIFLVKYKKV